MTDFHDETTPRTRELGAALRRHRLAARLPALDVARRLQVTASQISRVEKGERNLDDFDLATYLGMCEVSRDDLDAIAALAHETDGYRVKGHKGQLLDELRTLIFLETTATGIENYEPMLIPGLAQTEDYARALFLAGQRIRTPDAIEDHVRARMRRQRMLDRPAPPLLNLFIHEQALRAVVGSPQVMFEQMISLLLLTAHPHYRIYVVRTGSGPQSVLTLSFMCMRYDKHSPTIAVDSRTTTLLLDRPHDVDEYEFVLDQLAKVSLTTGDSRELIDKLAKEYADMM